MPRKFGDDHESFCRWCIQLPHLILESTTVRIYYFRYELDIPPISIKAKIIRSISKCPTCVYIYKNVLNLIYLHANTSRTKRMNNKNEPVQKQTNQIEKRIYLILAWYFSFHLLWCKNLSILQNFPPIFRFFLDLNSDPIDNQIVYLVFTNQIYTNKQTKNERKKWRKKNLYFDEEEKTNETDLMLLTYEQILFST